MARADFSRFPVLESWLAQVRAVSGLTEKGTGVFYWSRIPMLHFHLNDAAALADLKIVIPKPGGWDRFDVSKAKGRSDLLKALHGRVETLGRADQRKRAPGRAAAK